MMYYNSILSNELVDRLSFVRQLNIERLCKDCIFGKHIIYSFTDIKDLEKDIFK